MSTSNQKNAAINPSNTAIVLVDHQPGVLAMAASLPSKTIINNAATLAKLGEDLGIKTVITSTRENIEFLGTNFTEIQNAAPIAYANRIKRAGTLNAFHDKSFVEAVKNTNRPNLVMSGLLTDVCLYHSVVSALEAGYQVHVIADASGTSSQLGDSVTYDRLRDLGAVITTTFGILFQLYPDLSTEEGLKAEAVASSYAIQ
ncbi:isochorismatase family protein [Flavobacterium sp. GSB-24]|uniref:isochorismatase family protein n=1 Tax=Flavobacterium sp. GSB-24 TaxID=2994319 RepID=UPI002492C56C|nr:isochorismatase family protein [Flavobacterium sp. GSB-24]BDU25140.1 hydrolase [Flavobacterium sp. GSB-24]